MQNSPVRLESLPFERNPQNTATFHRYKFAPFDWGHGSLPTTSKPMATLRHAKICLHCLIRQDHRKVTSRTPLTLEDLGSKPFHEVIQVSQKTLVLSCHAVMQPNPLWASRSHKDLSPLTVHNTNGAHLRLPTLPTFDAASNTKLKTLHSAAWRPEACVRCLSSSPNICEVQRRSLGDRKCQLNVFVIYKQPTYKIQCWTKCWKCALFWLCTQGWLKGPDVEPYGCDMLVTHGTVESLHAPSAVASCCFSWRQTVPSVEH